MSTKDTKDILNLVDWVKPSTSYYGIKYGLFQWVRGTVEIYDDDDLNYVEICLKKMKQRFTEEKKKTEKKKND